MLESFPVILMIGTVLGFLAGLGIGGGSLLILWLTVLLNTPQPVARGINLLFFIPAATIVSLLRRKKGNLKFKPVLPAMVAGCISAGVFSLLSTVIDTQLLRAPFGILLLFTGVRELFYRPRKAK